MEPCRPPQFLKPSQRSRLKKSKGAKERSRLCDGASGSSGSRAIETVLQQMRQGVNACKLHTFNHASPERQLFERLRLSLEPSAVNAMRVVSGV